MNQEVAQFVAMKFRRAEAVQSTQRKGYIVRVFLLNGNSFVVTSVADAAMACRVLEATSSGVA